MASLNEEETRAMEDLLSAYEIILGWGLKYNDTELTQAMHTIQLFIIMRMLRRENPHEWGNWYT